MKPPPPIATWASFRHCRRMPPRARFPMSTCSTISTTARRLRPGHAPSWMSTRFSTRSRPIRTSLKTLPARRGISEIRQVRRGQRYDRATRPSSAPPITVRLRGRAYCLPDITYMTTPSSTSRPRCKLTPTPTRSSSTSPMHIFESASILRRSIWPDRSLPRDKRTTHSSTCWETSTRTQEILPGPPRFFAMPLSAIPTTIRTTYHWR